MNVRHVIPLLCIASVFACRDRDRSATTREDRSGRVDMPAAPLDRELSSPSGGVGTTTVTGATVGATQNQTAVARIVQARCERETSCNNVGGDKRFADREVCGREIQKDMQDDLNAKDCPGGIDQKELSQCLDSIKKESCGNPLETINRLAACRTSDMCLKTRGPNR
jgi:hypothetical protein